MNGEMDAVMRNKIENDTSAWLRSIVMKRGRNVDLAETTVRQAKAFSDKEPLDNHLIDRVAPDERALLAGLDGIAIKRFNGSEEVLHTARRGGGRLSAHDARADRRSHRRPEHRLHSARRWSAGSVCRILLARADFSGHRRRHSRCFWGCRR